MNDASPATPDTALAALTAQPVAQEPVAGPPITMTYRNYRGEIDRRTVVPTRIWFGSTDWHPEPGWLMSAYDLAKAAHRDFALADCQFADLAHPATPAPVEAGLRDWFSDCRVLMANLDALISHTGEAPEDEDGFMVDEIREAIALRAQSSPVGGNDTVPNIEKLRRKWLRLARDVDRGMATPADAALAYSVFISAITDSLSAGFLLAPPPASDNGEGGEG